MIQNDRVHDYLKQFGTITQLDAIRDLGVMRLASRVSDLKKKGVPIVTNMVGVNNRFGETTRIAEYRLNEFRLEAE